MTVVELLKYFRRRQYRRDQGLELLDGGGGSVTGDYSPISWKTVLISTKRINFDIDDDVFVEIKTQWYDDTPNYLKIIQNNGNFSVA